MYVVRCTVLFNHRVKTNQFCSYAHLRMIALAVLYFYRQHHLPEMLQGKDYGVTPLKVDGQGDHDGADAECVEQAEAGSHDVHKHVVLVPLPQLRQAKGQNCRQQKQSVKAGQA